MNIIKLIQNKLEEIPGLQLSHISGTSPDNYYSPIEDGYDVHTYTITFCLPKPTLDERIVAIRAQTEEQIKNLIEDYEKNK